MCQFDLILSFSLIFDTLLLLGRSLMIGWRKNSWKPERVPSVVTFVCVCHTFKPRNLIFGLSDPWDVRKKHFFFFKILFFYQKFSFLSKIFFFIKSIFLTKIFFFCQKSYCFIKNHILIKNIFLSKIFFYQKSFCNQKTF